VELVFHPINFSSSQSGVQGGGQSGTGAQAPKKDADVNKTLAFGFNPSLWESFKSLESEVTKSQNQPFSLVAALPAATQQTETIVTTKPALAMHTKTTQQGVVVETTIMANGSACLTANGVTNRFQQAPLTRDSIAPWAFIKGFTGAAYGPDALVGNQTDWVVNVIVPNPSAPSRTFSLNTAKLMISSKTGTIEEIDQHAMWKDSGPANAHLPDLYRDLKATLQIQYNTGDKIAPC
jgi:hypothetical protein